jgi:RES domain-containing protein
MSKRRKPPPPRASTSGAAGEADLPSLIELDRFTTTSLHQWTTAANRLQALHRALYFGLEPLRQQDSARLIDAMRSGTRNNFSINDWSRVVDYRYTLEPLSVAGSVKNDGGRFNIGAGLSPGSFTPFSALYLADDYPTALLERFGPTTVSKQAGLTAEDLALRKPASFTQVRVRGLLDNVLDVGDLAVLRPIADIIKEFRLPKSVMPTARKLGFRQAPWLIRSAIMLQRQLLHTNWRMLPMQFELPSNSQIFGRLVSAAGVHGILYPSTKDSAHQCLALFPQNWADSGSFVEVADAVPEGARNIRIDGTSR